MTRIIRIKIRIISPLLLLLFFTVLAPILLYPHKFITISIFYTYKIIPNNSTLKEAVGDVSLDNLTGFGVHSDGERFRNARELTEEAKGVDSNVVFQDDNPIEEVTRKLKEVGDGDNRENVRSRSNEHAKLAVEVETKQEAQKVGKKELAKKKLDEHVMADSRVRYLKDQLIRGRLYLSLSATRSNVHFVKQLRVRMKEVQKALGDATKDADLPKNAYDKLKAMDKTLAKGEHIHDDCTAIVRKLRAIIHSTEEQLRVHQKQASFLTHLTAKTVPKGLHCLPLRLSTEYYSLNTVQQFPNQENLDDPNLFHYALFSDNVLATGVVVNSTVTNAKDPSKHVFHIVTDKLNYAAMRMWFLVNPPGKATIQIQNIDEFTWLNASYSPALKQLASQNTIDYYFKTLQAGESGSNLKFPNPKYLSVMNHLRFYLPEIFPNLSKVVFLDDDIVVQKDLSELWSIDLKGNVNGAVETCGENFHRFDRYLNFSNPIIAKNFDPHACGWAYGMNVFDLEEWKKQNITEVYHSWQNLNDERKLWKLGTLPLGLITFWKRVYPLEKSWHVLGLGYNPSVSQKEIERAAVIHYSGNLKPWLEVGIPKFRGYWSRYVDYDQSYMRDCNVS